MCNELAQNASNEFLNRLKAKVSFQTKVPPLSMREEIGDCGAISTHAYWEKQLSFTSGGPKRVYFWAAFGVVNIANAMDAAQYVFKLHKDQAKPVLDLLIKGDFSVDALNTIAARGGTTINDFLRAVGRGLQ